MATTRAPSRGQEWMANGFPPRSFPNELETAQRDVRTGGVAPGATSLTRPGVSGRGGRGRWIAVAAVLLALLLLAGGLILATRGGDGGSDVAAGGTTTTALTDTTAPAFEVPTSLFAPTSIEPVGPTTIVDGATSTTTPAAGGTPGAGVLETSAADLAVPRVDTAAGPQSNRLTLRNTGPTALSYTTESSSPGLTASPAEAMIAPGGTTDVTVTLNGSRITSEGPFAGKLTFGGSGGSKVVQVTSTVGRPPGILDTIGERCAAASASCSRQIKVVPSSNPNATPCDTSWIYAVVITDQSQIQSAKVVARRNLANADAQLVSGGQPRGASGAYGSNPFPPLGPGSVLRFMVEAVDQYGFTVRLAQQTINC